MSRSILIADSNLGFAGMVQQAIVEAGFSCQTAATAREAIKLASSSPISLAIIDLDLPDSAPATFVADLRRASPGIILLGIPPDDDAQARELSSLGLQGTLSKPFYMPDFIPQLKTLLSESPPAHKEAASPGMLAAEEKLLEMLGIGGAETPPSAVSVPRGSAAPEPARRDLDFASATQASAVLARLTAGTAARASLLTHDGKLYSFAGELTLEHATQAARLVTGGWNRHERGIWLRYFRLQGTEEDLLLYSTPAGGKYVLALVFPSQTQAREARTLTFTILEGLYHVREEPPAVAQAKAGKTAVLPPRPEAAPAAEVAGKTRRLDPRKTRPPAKEGAAPAPAATSTVPRKPSTAPLDVSAPAPSSEGPGVRLNYNIVLTPADPAQRLLPDIAGELEGFVRTLVAKHGWRSQRITVRPDHCLISLSAPTSSSPSDIIRVLRSETSAHIVARLASTGATPFAGEYWTATHLLTTQEQPPTPGQIANFIAQTRKSQPPPSASASAG